jgi:hypothetical protein
MTESGCNTRYNARMFYASMLDDDAARDVTTFVNELMAERGDRNPYDRERPTTTWLRADDGLVTCIVEWWDYPRCLKRLTEGVGGVGWSTPVSEAGLEIVGPRSPHGNGVQN